MFSFSKCSCTNRKEDQENCKNSISNKNENGDGLLCRTKAKKKNCRICFSTHNGANMAAPCRCRGNMKYVHQECLLMWRKKSGNPMSALQCDICHFPYRFKQDESQNPKSKGAECKKMLKRFLKFVLFLIRNIGELFCLCLLTAICVILALQFYLPLMSPHATTTASTIHATTGAKASPHIFQHLGDFMGRHNLIPEALSQHYKCEYDHKDIFNFVFCAVLATLEFLVLVLAQIYVIIEGWRENLQQGHGMTIFIGSQLLACTVFLCAKMLEFKREYCFAEGEIVLDYKGRDDDTQ